jgi:hypothetical protein
MHLGARIRVALVLIALHTAAMESVMAQARGLPVVPYGARNAAAPPELDAFSFLVGKWKGVAKVRLENGDYAENDVIWIGRYVLGGMAIADEGYSVGPGGAARLEGYSLRFFDPTNRSWTVDFVNVARSFVRHQVNPRTGSVQLDGASVVVSAEDDTTMGREYYRVSGKDSFVYTIDLSRDGGKSWDSGVYQMTMTRVE